MIGARRLTGRGSRGAALIEFALILPLLLMLLVGIVSAGVAYNHQLGLTHAAREAGRYGATLPVTNFGSLNQWLDEVAARAVDEATGSLGAGVDGHFVCVAYVFPDGGQVERRVDNEGVITHSGGDCFSDDRPSEERRVQVRVRRDSEFSVVFFSTTVTLGSEATNRYELGQG